MNWAKPAIGLYLVFGLAEIIGEIYQVGGLIYVFKPLLMPCLLVYLWSEKRGVGGFPLALTIGALVMSGFGDVFLMFGNDFFVLGLGSFLVAQIAYVLVYDRAARGSSKIALRSWRTYLTLGLLLIYGFYLISRIQPQLGSMLAQEDRDRVSVARRFGHLGTLRCCDRPVEQSAR